MLVIAVAWMFVVVLVAVVEATAPNGSALGALGTLFFWGALPLALVLYLMAATARRRQRRAAAHAAAQPASATDPDGRSHAPGDAVAPEREEP
jgi:hypothetical protein